MTGAKWVAPKPASKDFRSHNKIKSYGKTKQPQIELIRSMRLKYMLTGLDPKIWSSVIATHSII